MYLRRRPHRDAIHAVVLIGDASKDAVEATRAEIDALFTPHVALLGEETGLGRTNAAGDGVEHFGYVDGRSQPLFLEQDIENERRRQDGTSVWDPAFALGRVLVQDIAAPEPVESYGSFFVLRKLEQNVRAFHQAELAFADGLRLEGEDRKRAGAMIVGRFRDGTDEGAKCPLFAHIRKTNPRGLGGVESEADERLHLMARRGQTYGERTDARTVDLVIGQGERPDAGPTPDWGGSLEAHFPMPPQTVTMKGGEYFFMPSLPFLKAL